MAEQVIRVMGYTPSDNSVFPMVMFYNASDELRKYAIDPSKPLRIILDGRDSNNSAVLVSHDFYDVYDVLLDIYDSWENVVANVVIELDNLSIHSNKLEYLDLFTEDLEYRLGPNIVVR